MNPPRWSSLSKKMSTHVVSPGDYHTKLEFIGLADTEIAMNGVVAHSDYEPFPIQPIPPVVRVHDPAYNPPTNGFPSPIPSQSTDAVYPVVLRNCSGAMRVTGLTVQGDSPDLIPWRTRKQWGDGDGLLVKNGSGTITVQGCTFQRCMDGFSPRNLDYWTVANTIFRDIFDDAIENDGLISGTLQDVLIDGAFMGVSARPGGGGYVPPSPPVTKILNCAIWVKPFPHDGELDSPNLDQYLTYDNGVPMGSGQFFKWSANAGTVTCRNVAFRMDQTSRNGPSSMIWPPGTYKNCTLTWTGDGSHPAKPITWPGAPLPSGVTLAPLATWEAMRDSL